MDLMAAQFSFAQLQNLMGKHMDSGVSLPLSNPTSTNYIWYRTIFIKEMNICNSSIGSLHDPHISNPRESPFTPLIFLEYLASSGN